MGNIDVHDFSTYPPELEKIRESFNELLKEKRIVNIDSYENFNDSVRELFHKNTNYVLKPLCNEIDLVLSNHRIICYHNSRIINKERILKEGLRFLSNGYLKYIQEVLKKHLEIEDVKTILSNIREEIAVDDNQNFDKSNQICFYLNKKFHEKYNKFYGQFGGEVLEHAIRYDKNCKHLLSLGEPYIIKFFLPYTALTRSRDELITEILRYWLESHGDMPINNIFCFEGIVNEEVPKENILEIIPVA